MVYFHGLIPPQTPASASRLDAFWRLHRRPIAAHVQLLFRASYTRTQSHVHWTGREDFQGNRQAGQICGLYNLRIIVILKSMCPDGPVIYEGNRSLLRQTASCDMPSGEREAGVFG